MSSRRDKVRGRQTDGRWRKWSIGCRISEAIAHWGRRLEGRGNQRRKGTRPGASRVPTHPWQVDFGWAGGDEGTSVVLQIWGRWRSLGAVVWDMLLVVAHSAHGVSGHRHCNAL